MIFSSMSVILQTEESRLELDCEKHRVYSNFYSVCCEGLSAEYGDFEYGPREWCP